MSPEEQARAVDLLEQASFMLEDIARMFPRSAQMVCAQDVAKRINDFVAHIPVTSND